MSDETITFLIVGVTVAVFVWDRLPVGVVAFGVALSLWATGVLTLDQSLAGFGDPTVIFIASLFVVSEALDATGVTAWAGGQLIVGAGASLPRLMVLMLGTVAVLTALISVNGSVAALLPVVAVTAVRLRVSPKALFMPSRPSDCSTTRTRLQRSPHAGLTFGIRHTRITSSSPTCPIATACSAFS